LNELKKEDYPTNSRPRTLFARFGHLWIGASLMPTQTSIFVPQDLQVHLEGAGYTIADSIGFVALEGF